MSHSTDNVIDYGNVPDTFAAELTQIETIGPVCRLTFTAPQTPPGGTPQKVVVARLIVPADLMSRMARQLESGRLDATLAMFRAAQCATLDTTVQ